MRFGWSDYEHINSKINQKDKVKTHNVTYVLVPALKEAQTK